MSMALALSLLIIGYAFFFCFIFFPLFFPIFFRIFVLIIRGKLSLFSFIYFFLQLSKEN